MYTITFEDTDCFQWTHELLFNTFKDAKIYLERKGFIINGNSLIRGKFNWSEPLQAFISFREVYND